MSACSTACERNVAETSCGASASRFDKRQQTADTSPGVTALSWDDGVDDIDDVVADE